MTALVSTSVPQYIASVQKPRNRARDQSVSPISPGCCATHYQTPPKLRVSSEHLSPMLTPSPLRRRPLFPADAQRKADGLAQEQDHDDSDIFLQSPFKSPPLVHRLYPISHPKPIKPIMLDDDEATLFLSSSSAVSSPFFHHASTQPLLTPVKDSHRAVLAAKQLNSQPAHRVGVGTKRKSAQSGGGDFSTPLRPVSSATCTPLNISAPKPDPSSGIAFHRLAPLPAPRFTPQPKSKADTDAFLKRQAETMKRLRIRDLDDSDEDWGIIDRDSDGEPVQRLPALRKCKSRSISPKKSFLINAALVPQKGSSKDEVTEAISPGGHIIKRRARSRPVSIELLESVNHSPSPKAEYSNTKLPHVPITFPSVSRDRNRPTSFVGSPSPVPRRRLTGSSGPNPFLSHPPSRLNLHSQPRPRPFARIASNSSATHFFGPSIPQSVQCSRKRTNSSVDPTLDLCTQSRLSPSNRHSYAGPNSTGVSVAPMSWTLRSGLDTPSPNSSPLNDGPGTVYSDDEEMLFEGPTESSFVFSITEGTPSPRSQKGKEGLLPSKYKPRDSGIVLSDDESIPARNSALSRSSSSIYSDNDNGDDLVTPGVVPGALSGWPRISGVDDAHLHSFNQSHPYQYFNHDEDDVDAFILRTLEAGGKPSATEGKKPPGTPVKKLKSHFGLDGERPWQSAVASKIGFSFDGVEGGKGNAKKPRKSLPAAFPLPLVKGNTMTTKTGGSDTEEDEETISPSSRKQYKGLGLGRPAGRWLMRRSSSGAFSSGESTGGTPTRRNINLKDWPIPAARTLTVDTTGSRSSSNSSMISLNSPTIARHLPSKTSATHSHSPLGPRSRKMSVIEHVRNVSDAGRFEKEFVEVEQVGSGEFGKVIKVRAKIGRGFEDTVWAVKRSKPFEGPRHRLRLREEVDILAHLSARGAHSNVLTYVDKLCELGNFARFLWEYGRAFPRLDEARVWKIMVDLSNGLRFIHEAGIIHLDLKPANIFLTREGRFKIGDFGMASVWPRPGGAFEREGDKVYLAREVLQGTYGKAADIFSLGMTMLETATNIVVPDQGDGWHRLRQEDFSQMDLDGSPELFALIKSMMRTDPARRVDVHGVCAHTVVSRARAAMERIYEEAKRDGTSLFAASPLAGVSNTFLEEILGRDYDDMDLSP
ncbi:uncharacterized protein F5891DRAFT_1058076 [Suillus fuscotomentosus]|uniref:Protein kinase domain-containing protein n=1 Tax=Suillus fuscotomentosus TaxID=1912939 RepID=A0AAD4DWW6_9AGAM|nr:uncharacterized protein F5891DRAFT_1058076 [Suillus fuscotomentosus]KAG1895570.1 hypothetical protein F5891DRAFT_1058076 [Suillus fuscotomentosus]